MRRQTDDQKNWAARNLRLLILGGIALGILLILWGNW